MAIIVDTSVLIDYLRTEEAALEALRGARSDGEQLVASVLTKVEVLTGMRASEERTTRHLLGRFDWIEVDDELAERAGEWANRYEPSHPGIGPVDYVIAATAERLGARLWTLNVRHFPMFPGLEPPY